MDANVQKWARKALERERAIVANGLRQTCICASLHMQAYMAKGSTLYDFEHTPLEAKIKSPWRLMHLWSLYSSVSYSLAKVPKRGPKPLICGNWCRRRDSNPHGFPHTPLKRACLPVPPLRRRGDYRSARKVLSIKALFDRITHECVTEAAEATQKFASLV